MDQLISAALGHPGVLRWVGRLLCSIATALALLGLPADRLVRRLSSAAEPSGLRSLLPSWLAWALPETFLDWLGMAILFAVGVGLIRGARAIERLTHR